MGEGDDIFSSHVYLEPSITILGFMETAVLTPSYFEINILQFISLNYTDTTSFHTSKSIDASFSNVNNNYRFAEFSKKSHARQHTQIIYTRNVCSYKLQQCAGIMTPLQEKVGVFIAYKLQHFTAHYFVYMTKEKAHAYHLEKYNSFLLGLAAFDAVPLM